MSDAPTPADEAAIKSVRVALADLDGMVSEAGFASCVHDLRTAVPRLLALVAAQAEQIARLTGERDRAREECGHEKAMRAHGSEELSTFVRLNRGHRERAQRAEAAVERVRALCDGRDAPDIMDEIRGELLTSEVRAALDGAE